MIGRLSFAGASLLHLLLLFGLLAVSMPRSAELTITPQAVSVELLVLAPDTAQPEAQAAQEVPEQALEQPSLAAVAREPAALPPPSPAPVPLPTPAAPVADAVVQPPPVLPPPPVAVPVVAKSALAAVVAAPAPAPAPAPVAAPVVAPKRPAFDPNSLSSLLDKASPARKRPAMNAAALSSLLDNAQPQGAARLNAFQAASLEAAIRAQITPCWNVPKAPDGAGKIVVLLGIVLSPAGALVGIPKILSVTGISSGTAAYGRALAGSVRRAVTLCAPLKLPAEHYQAWREIELNFDASQAV